jgi:TRAP transporter TAXI family solute receptor
MSPITRRAFLVRLGAAAGAASLPPLALGCDVREYARAHGGKRRLSVATGPLGGVYYMYGGGIARVISQHLPGVEATAEVTSASVDNLKFLRDARADLALVVGPTLDDAFRGTGAFASLGRVPVNAVALLYVQPTHFVSLAERGISGLRDLRGKTVSTGPAGSGTEELVLRILRAAGIDPESELRRERLGPGNAAEALRDGKIDGFFWSSGVPAAAVLDLATSFGGRLRILPTIEVLPELQRSFGQSLFIPSTIPRGSYPALDSDVETVGVASILVADAGMNEELVYEITSTIFAHLSELAAIHPEAARLTPAIASTGSPVPFHPGAVRYYRERGAWRS